jgi:flagellar L-ring protein precursor FlgH
MTKWWLLAAALAAGWLLAQERSPLDRYIEEAMRTAALPPLSSGSLYTAEGPLSEITRDPRARLVNDLITIVVTESATALAKGTTTTSRKSSAKGGVTSLYGAAAGPFANLVNTSNANALEGEGTTTRQSSLTTRLSARVTHVLPNGYLVVEGHREVMVNSERQLVSIRGVARPSDLSRDNSLRSDRLAQMEVRINGKGVVNDAVRRPFFLYRLLLGLLPF